MVFYDKWLSLEKLAYLVKRSPEAALCASASSQVRSVYAQLHQKSWGEYFLDSFLVLSCYKLEMIEVLSGGSDEHTAYVCSKARACGHTFMWAK